VQGTADVPPGDVCAPCITTPTGADYYSNDPCRREIVPASGAIKKAELIEADGRAAFVRHDPQGRVTAASAIAATFLRCDSRPVSLQRTRP